ncbi:unnamed protein product [Arabidopsis lyrata]|nr:uncharacterized protein LOC9315864 [Arabidopsis lyrata subsp. lyrata]XP_020883746.1 uncharacterized protein LOC9315864 [Arabidopsis lyrata subsp. lyrata]CAH8265299.1 unnamed protein product [Arabidopsis lyrata]|eukprot:XP_020883745.1 uncharacterized protein LOC9315864 [Arabidopsis lyrata subsp. lyrata]
MESKEIRSSSVIERSMRFNGLFQPLHQDKLRVVKKQNQQIQKESISGFTVIPTQELCRVYLRKPNLLASKGIIDALAKPPHRNYGRRYHQNLKSKLRHHHTTSVDTLKHKFRKKENSLRYFTPLGFGSGSCLGDRKKVKDLSFEEKPKEMKKLFDGTTFGQKKERVVREVKSSLMVSTTRDRVAADVKFKDLSSSGFISKDKNDESLDCSNASLECLTNSEEAHQPSPVSVLEPMFYEDILDDSEDILDDSEDLPYPDFQSLEKQLETLKSESESYSDGSGMEVSSDEESVLDSETKESKDSTPIGFLDTQESRDSSYIDDILAEVVLGDKNWVPGKRDSLDLVIIPKIFEKLEKKYYAETSWKRSERKILFDRVNSGLVEILESFSATPTWKKPVFRRLGTTLSTCGLKQELWKVLARQEKRAKKESLAKVPVIDIDEWLELEADDESVVCELESLIVDELLAEVVSFM